MTDRKTGERDFALVVIAAVLVILLGFTALSVKGYPLRLVRMN